ncbi:hypothetical protein QTP86_034170 [Hemibagrus guttatus]|nr:hypothetical protein QTP86_034170 [Hemibagrus guttatus]
MKEMVVDFRRAQSDHSPLNIDGSNVEIVKSTKFLGVHVAEDLTWSLNTSTITKKAQQRLYFLRRLRKAHLPPPILTTFYRGTIKSILSSCITAWFGNCTASDRKTLQRIVRTAEKIIGVSLPSITDIYSTRCIRKASSIVDDSTHPSHTLFTFLPSGKRISRRSQGLEGVRFGDHRISLLLFADDVVLLAPSDLDLQHALGCFAAECEAAGMRVSTSKSEAMVLDRKKAACTLQVVGEFLPQVEEFKYLGVFFTTEGRMDRDIDRQIGAAAAVMWSMYRSVVVKKELNRKGKLSIYQSIYVPTLTYGHELWVMTERIRSQIQAAEMSFLRRVAGRYLRDRVRSSVTREEFGVEPLLLHIERVQLRWLGHLFWMPPGRLPGEVFRACPTGKRPWGRPRTHWRDYVSRVTWEHLRIPPKELEEVSGERKVSASLLRLLPPRPGSG